MKVRRFNEFTMYIYCSNLTKGMDVPFTFYFLLHKILTLICIYFLYILANTFIVPMRYRLCILIIKEKKNMYL